MSRSPGSTDKSKVETISFLCCDDRFVFLTSSGGGDTTGSGAGASMVRSYSLNNGGAMIFLPKKLDYEHTKSFAWI
jgi:hypothetical protein